MGILNVTPDSFSDGGEHILTPAQDALQMARQGASIIDIGGQSTRPGAQLATLKQERERVIPVVKALSAARDSGLLADASCANEGGIRNAHTLRAESESQSDAHRGPAPFRISVDTMRSAIAAEALAAGADIINDVSAGTADPQMAPLIAANPGAQLVAMHSRGAGAQMQSEDYGADVVTTVLRELSGRIEQILQAGVRESQLILDPGPGFSKAGPELNFPLLARLGEFQALGFPVLVAASRKRFLSQFGEPKERDIATAALSLLAAEQGAWGVRVHNVKASADVLEVRRLWRKYQ